MLIRTGPGRVIDNINPQLNPGGRYDLWKFLANFDIDGDDLKVVHMNWLYDNIVRGDHSRWIFLRGWTSRTASPIHNLNLSYRRLHNVQNYITDNGFPLSHVTGRDYIGELWSNEGPDENWRHRCVEVIVSPDRLDPVPPPHVLELDETAIVGRLARHFKIRVLGALQLGAGIAGSGLVIEIWDTTYNLACRYAYFGVGMGVSVPGSPQAWQTVRDLSRSVDAGMSLAGRFGQWHYFSTRAHIDVENFAGPRCSFLHLDIGGRSRPLGMTEEEYQDTLSGQVGQALFTPYFEFTADPFGPAHEHLSVRIDIPQGVLSGLPTGILTSGSLITLRGPYSRNGP